MVHRVVDHSEIPQQTTFGCELTIPGTEYHHREQSRYKHRGGRKYILELNLYNIKCLFNVL